MIPFSGYITGGTQPAIADLVVFDVYSSPAPGLLAMDVDLTKYPKVRPTSRSHCIPHMSIVSVCNSSVPMSIVRGAREEGRRVLYGGSLCQGTWFLD